MKTKLLDGDLRRWARRRWTPSRMAAAAGCTERTVYRRLQAAGLRASNLLPGLPRVRVPLTKLEARVLPLLVGGPHLANDLAPRAGRVPSPSRPKNAFDENHEPGRKTNALRGLERKGLMRVVPGRRLGRGGREPERYALTNEGRRAVGRAGLVPPLSDAQRRAVADNLRLVSWGLTACPDAARHVTLLTRRGATWEELLAVAEDALVAAVADRREGVALSTWFVVKLRGKLSNALRSPCGRTRTRPLAGDEAAPVGRESVELPGEWAGRLSRLPVAQRRAVELVVLGDRPVPVAAMALGVDPKTLARRLEMGLAGLRAMHDGGPAA